VLFGIVIALLFIAGGIYLVWMPPSYRERMRDRSFRIGPETWDVPLMRGAGVMGIIVGLAGLIVTVVAG
jgi:hypothetical protein